MLVAPSAIKRWNGSACGFASREITYAGNHRSRIPFTVRKAWISHRNMSTPVLTKQQQRHSLSAKKTPVKGLRNVLAQPHENFWPLVPKCSKLEDIFKNLAPAARRSHVRRKRSKTGDREETAVNEQATEDLHVSEKPDLVRSILLGINAVARSLETNTVCCVLLDSDIDPPFLVKHILTMTQNKKVPVLLVPSLKTITGITIGVPSASFGLKNIVKETKDHHFYPLYEHVSNTFKELPLSKNSLSLFNNTSLNDSEHKDHEITTKKEPESKNEPSTPFTLSTNVYKYRSSRMERAFVPPGVNETSPQVKTESTDFISMNVTDSKPEESLPMETQASDFIPLGDNDSDTEENTAREKKRPKLRDANSTRTGVKYLPLRVKRIQGNGSRTKATKMRKPKKK